MAKAVKKDEKKRKKTIKVSEEEAKEDPFL